ncbi:MAG: hypothetical protein ABS879_04730, partial [Eubacteriales bacterium]
MYNITGFIRKKNDTTIYQRDKMDRELKKTLSENLKKQLEEEKNKGCETVLSSISTPEIKEIPESRKEAEPENALPEEDTESKE